MSSWAHRAAAISALSISLGLAVGQQASAQEQGFQITANGRMLQMELGGHAVGVPGPLWGGSSSTESTYVFNRVGADAESLTLMPQGENLVTWSQMMGVIVVARPDYDGPAQIKDIVTPLEQSCTHNQLGVSTVPPIVAGAPEALVVVCGRYLPTAEGKPRNCTGGLVVAVVLQRPTGSMRVYREWCTSGFDFADTGNWPVSAIQLVAQADELQRAVRFGSLPAAAPGVPDGPEPVAPAMPQ